VTVADADHVFHRSPNRPIAVRATGVTITTADGREYLDGCGGAIACSIGHGRAEIVQAIAAQASTVDYLNAAQFESASLTRMARRLAMHVPVDDARVFPVSGGSEATESALKLARAYHIARGDTERHVILARAGAYHGNSRGALDASDRSILQRGYEPWLGRTVRTPMANLYRDGRGGVEHAAELERIIVATGADRIAAFIAEPVSGATLAAAVPPHDYWREIAAVCRRHDILLVADEVMTGFGRTGEWFAMQHWGVRPDVLTCGKGASSGYWPLGILVASGEVHDVVDRAGTYVHGFTWSHHPIGAAVADAVIGVIERDGLVECARDRGDQLGAWLDEALGAHPNVGDIRGLGLLRGVEFVANRDSKEPFPRSARVAERVTESAFDRGLAVYPCPSAVDGRVGDAVMLGPPLSVTEDELAEMVSRLVAAVRSVLAPDG
jgi:adenosylmethionine-8-amino-7-oxononanoate aminotransferase